tara:strand:+ start:2046 stop:2342 length:297 start_codon:yes stop_codon:yes gene_type:complete
LVLDKVKGSAIRSNLIKTINIIDSKNVAYTNNESINRLNHTITITAYYIFFSSKFSLYDSPIVNKNIIRHNLKDFLSNQFQLKDCSKISTSGFNWFIF